MSTLKELVIQASMIEDLIIESGGEITPEIESLLKNVDLKLPEKIDGYSLFMERMKVVSEFYRTRANRLLAVARASEAVIDHCKHNLKSAMQELGVNELSGHDVRFKLTNSKPKLILEPNAALPDKYMRVEYSPDKELIYDALTTGEEIPGAHLESSTHIREYNAKPK